MILILILILIYAIRIFLQQKICTYMSLLDERY